MLALKIWQKSHLDKRTRRAGRKVLKWMWKSKPREASCYPLKKKNIESCPRLLYILTKYFIRHGWPWHIPKLNARQITKGPLLLWQQDDAHSGSFPSSTDLLLPTCQQTAHLYSLNFVRSFVSSGSNRHPQGTATWAPKSGLWPSSAWERKCSAAGAAPEGSCQCDVQTEGLPLSDHLLVPCWGNLHCRPHFWPAGTQPHNSEQKPTSGLTEVAWRKWSGQDRGGWTPLK